MRYEKDTVYTATVNAGNSVHRIYFLFSVYHTHGKRVSIGEGIHTGPEWNVYHVDTVTEVRLTPSEVHHICSEGTWIMTTPYGCYPTWQFKTKDGHMYEPEISLANEEEYWRGKHYDTSTDPETLAQRNYREMVEEDKRRGSILMDNPILKKEVKNKMYLQLIDVTIFNRKTKQVDFHEDIIAENNDEAYLLAVQAFGKYDPKVHVKAAKCVLGFNEIGDKEED